MKPEFFSGRLAVFLRQLQNAAAAAVCRRNKQQIVVAPNRRTDIQSPLGNVRMTPKQFAVVGIDAGNNFAQKATIWSCPSTLMMIGDDGDMSRVWFFHATVPSFWLKAISVCP